MKDHRRRDPHDDISVTGYALLDKVKDLVRQGNVRRLIVRRPSGKVLADIPLTAGVGVAGVLTLLTPMLVALGAMAALVAQFRIEIERESGVYEQDPYDR